MAFNIYADLLHRFLTWEQEPKRSRIETCVDNNISCVR